MSPLHSLGLFEAFGIELEYMIVDRKTLNVRPIADQLIFEAAGEYDDVERDSITWSNELVTHVIELKTTKPTAVILDNASLFQSEVSYINDLLEKQGACLLPSAMHPWMNPTNEMSLWPHGNRTIYETFNRIFDCKGHGWANLQSVHLNLPFSNDEEFARLHTAIRLILPLLPGIAASSPIVDRAITGSLDNRLEFYRNNSKKVPRVCGQVVPDFVMSASEYESKILKPLYEDIAPFDPDGILQVEWLNARGAIARFDRNAIEIRVLDIQECPAADLAILQAIVEILKALISEKWSSFESQSNVPTQLLYETILNTMKLGEHATIQDSSYLEQFGVNKSEPNLKSIWSHLLQELGLLDSLKPLQQIIEHGTLASRIVAAVDSDPNRIEPTYRQLAQCLSSGSLFSVPKMETQGR